MLVLVVRPAAGQENRSAAFRPVDTSSPRATLRGFVDACNEAYRLVKQEPFVDRTSTKLRPVARRILDCIDGSELADFERTEALGEAAICLKEILDRVDFPAYSEVPDLDAIERAGGAESLPRYRLPGTRITIARVQEGPRRHEYLFTPGTVDRAIEYYRDLKGAPYRRTGPTVTPGFYEWYMTTPGHPWVAAIVDRLPHWFRGRTGETVRWKWIGLVMLTTVAVLIVAVLYRWYGDLAARTRKKSLFRYCLTLLLPIAAVGVALWFKSAGLHWLTLRGSLLYAVSFTSNLVALLAALVVVFGASDRLAAVVIASPHINPRGLDAQFIRLLSKIASVVVSVIVLLEGGNYLGIPLTTLIASAGVGGLAVALAAQDTLKNLFGTIMLLADKPFRVGERIVFSRYDGVVEDIGLRSTQIRLLTGHQASIPNDELARSDIENIGRRQHIRRIADIHIPLDTTPEKLDAALAAVRAAIENHEGMAPDYPPRVYFVDIDAEAYVLRVIYWYHPPEYWDYLAMSERFNLQVCRDFERLGVRFWRPLRLSQTPADELNGLTAGPAAPAPASDAK
ncbi:MAG: mechanosensitive ion channel family protein [Planctomycetota bacterium]